MGKHSVKRKKRWFIIPVVVLLVVLVGAGIYGLTTYQNAKQTVNKHIYTPVSTIEHKVTKKKIEDKEPLNVLLLGVDARSYDSGRSDAMMVLSLDPKENSAKLVSIPRDTRTEIIGKGFLDKINHAYAFGGAEMSIATVENLLDVELDYYVKVNMEGLAAIVDEIGGITVDNEIAFGEFELGPINLNGEQALKYARMRKQDPRGDFGRTERQRKVIQGIIDQGATIGSVTRINDLIDILGNNVATNMDFDDMKNLMFNYRNTRQNFSTYQLQGQGTTINGIYYMAVTEEEINKVHEMIDK